MEFFSFPSFKGFWIEVVKGFLIRKLPKPFNLLKAKLRKTQNKHMLVYMLCPGEIPDLWDMILMVMLPSI